MCFCFSDHDNRNVDEEYKKKRELDKKKWHAADFNHDNMLTRDEYSAYLHPSEYRRMHAVAAEDILKGVDTDKDGYISLEEYIGKFFVILIVIIYITYFHLFVNSYSVALVYCLL